MVLRVRLYRVHDLDLYMLYLGVGREMFIILLKDALMNFIDGEPRKVILQPARDKALKEMESSEKKRVITVSFNTNKGFSQHEIDVLSNVDIEKLNLFMKNVMRSVMTKELLQFYGEVFSEQKMNNDTGRLPDVKRKEEPEQIQKPKRAGRKRSSDVSIKNDEEDVLKETSDISSKGLESDPDDIGSFMDLIGGMVEG